MRALVLEKKGELSLREIALPLDMGPDDVRIAIHTVGVCGSDVHYYTHGAIGSYVVRAPMVLGHEASGTIVEVGANVDTLKVGDRVCMEPGVPNLASRATKLGIYNVDPDVTFWATPPVHGVLAPYAVHPAAFTYKLPDNVSFAEGAMVEPFAIGMQAASRARIVPGDVAVVIGDGMVGQWAAQTLAHRGADVTVLGRHDDRLALLPSHIRSYNLKRHSLSDWTGDRGDIAVVVDSVGAMGTFRELKPAMRLNSHLVSAGFLGAEGMVDIQELRPQEITLHSPSGWTTARMDATLAGIRDGWLSTTPLISHRFPAEKAAEAWQLIMDKTEPFLGIVLEWSKS